MKERDLDLLNNAFANEVERKLIVEILRSVREIRYGKVEIVIHDSKVVQIDKTEKIRV